MDALVSLTDRAWFDHLAGRAQESGGRLDEVNFWRPRSQQALRSVRPGAPFFLRLKSPVNAIAGFGFFAHWHLVPFLEAWSLFGEKNGAPTLADFRRQIASLRGSDPLQPGQRPLGCVILRDVTFLQPDEWVQWGKDRDWSPNIVNDKVYDLTAAPGDQLLALIADRAQRPPDLDDRFQLVDCDTRNWREQVVARREGQAAFKLRLLEAYGSRCAVTGEMIPLDELKYWSVARQEAYVSAAVSLARELEANPDLRRRG